MPKVIESSRPSRPAVMRAPLMQVPFELPRSFTSTAVGPDGQLGVTAGDRRIVDRDVAGESPADDERPALGELEGLVTGSADESQWSHA